MERRLWPDLIETLPLVLSAARPATVTAGAPAAANPPSLPPPWREVASERGLLPAELLDLRDDALSVALETPGGGERAALHRLVTHLEALAEALAEARARIPPPAAMSGTGIVAAWHRLASRLGGVLEPARMALVGTSAGAAAEVITTWHAGGVPDGTQVVLHAQHVGSPDGRTVYVSRGHLASWEKAERRWPPAARAARDAVFAGPAYTLSAAPGELRAVLPAPLFDPAPAERALEALAGLAAALQPEHPAAPYR